MKYMLLIYGNEQAADEAMQEQCYREAEQAAQRLDAAGQYLDAAPLRPASLAVSVRVRDGKRLVTDGPFAETREQLGGYFLIDAGTQEEAIAVAAELPMAHVSTIEIRSLIELPGLPKK